MALLVAGHQPTPSLDGYDFVAARLIFTQVQQYGVCAQDCTKTPAFWVQAEQGGLSRYHIAARAGDYAIVASACTSQELDVHEFLVARETYASCVGFPPEILFLPVSLAHPVSPVGGML
jgi:hypothetical protein